MILDQDYAEMVVALGDLVPEAGRVGVARLPSRAVEFIPEFVERFNLDKPQSGAEDEMSEDAKTLPMIGGDRHGETHLAEEGETHLHMPSEAQFVGQGKKLDMFGSGVYIRLPILDTELEAWVFEKMPQDEREAAMREYGHKTAAASK